MYSSTVSLTSVLDRGCLLIPHPSHLTGDRVGLGACS
jgi:hypothetical protein